MSIKWTEKETEKLRFEYESEIPIEKIAKNHGRTKEVAELKFGGSYIK